MSTEVLVVGGDGLDRLRRCLTEAGFEVESAPDGFYATLFLERRRPAAVLVPTRLPDMKPQELGRILADDEALAAVQRILVPLPGEGAPDAETAAEFDFVAPADTPPERLASRIAAAIDPRRPRAAPEAESEPRLEAGTEVSLSGTFEAVDFAQLTQLLATTRLAGVLRIDLEGGEGLIYFDRGEVIHCAWGETEGWPAFREVLRAALSTCAPFRYHRLAAAEVFRLPKTLGAPVTRLLLSAAVELDEAPHVTRAAAREGRTGA